jgi:uncharacterized membrane protein
MIYAAGMPAIMVFSRWLHVISACLAIGGVFFIRFILPRGLRTLDEVAARQSFLVCRRNFKMLIHAVILLLILTGIYNTYLAWDKYKLDEAVLHSVWGVHVLLATLAFVISLYVLAGREPPPSYRKLMAVNFVILLLVVAAGSTLKWARERAVAEHSAEISSAR